MYDLLIASTLAIAFQDLFLLPRVALDVATRSREVLSSGEYVLPPLAVRRIFYLVGSVNCYQPMSVAPSIMHHGSVPRFVNSIDCLPNQQVVDTQMTARYVQELLCSMETVKLPEASGGVLR